MRRRPNAEIEHGEFGLKLSLEMRMREVIMAAGKLRENVHHSENELGQTPIGVVEN